MRCLYCEVEVTSYPENGLCQHCGGRLPPKPAQQSSQPSVQYLHVHMPHDEPLTAGVNCCPKCYSTQIIRKKRGFSWGLAILGLCFLSILGLPLGFCGRNKLRGYCTKCGHKWKL